MSLEKFKISSALKNLIGKELITDEFVAIFELVKNSFDANATKVTIKFENNRNRTKDKISIIDNGVGMDEADLLNKWLFVAYSAKKDKVEPDYRDKIQTKRVFAGAKGVGRFSCDRLGKKLNLITVKKQPKSKIEQLTINWEDFEQDPNKEFVSINVQHETLKVNPYNFPHGTVLEISELRDFWDRERLIKLKRSLEKLVNPNQKDDSDNFRVEIIADDEKFEDLDKKEIEKVNGEVKNFLFEQLSLKTTYLTASISNDGEELSTTLIDRGRTIYKVKEMNTYQVDSEKLRGIEIHLFQLNRVAKLNFTRMMGVPSREFGSIFLYKNGFRIYPFGEVGEDLLRIDSRKQQGYNRFLGSRDLVGRIEIYGDNPDFIESTSRDGGLIKNEHYERLITFFYEKALKRLEKYVVEVISWGDIRKTEDNELPALIPEDVREKILEVISTLVNSKEFLSVNYDKDFLQIIEERQEKSVSKTIRNFEQAVARTGDVGLKKDVEKLKREFKKITEDTQKAEEKADQESERANKAEAKLEYTIGQNHFLKEAVDVDKERLLSLNHHINHATQRVETNIKNLIKAVEGNAPKEDIFGIIEIISLENTKAAIFSKYFRKTNFNTMTVRITKDLVAFVNEYLENVYKSYQHSGKLKIEIETPPDLSFVRKFRPIDITIIFDNLLHNSAKADAKKVTFKWEKVSMSHVKLHVVDNGNGILDSLLENIFDFGFTTTTNGTGLGLFHVSQIITEMNGSIEVNNRLSKGVDFVLNFNK